MEAMIHLQQQSSLLRALLEVPGPPGSAGSGVDRFWAGSRALRSAGVPPGRCPRSRSSRTDGPAGALSDTRAPSTPGHLAATPGQPQPLAPAFKCSGQSCTEPTRCHPGHRVLQGREPSAVPRHECAGPFTTREGASSSSTRRERASVACVTSPKAGVRKHRPRGGARGNKSRSAEGKEGKSNQGSLLSESHHRRCSVKTHS